MSRLGKRAIQIPKGVEIKVTKDQEINVKGPLGSSVLRLVPGIEIVVQENQLHVECDQDKVSKSSFHGLYRALIANMVVGVHTGFTKKLVLVGTGYRVAVQGKQLELKLGFSHPTLFAIPEGIKAEVDKDGALVLTGYDKQKLGEFAATLRAKKPPEPYKGKGVRYANEFVRKKAGKAAAKK